MPRRLPDRCNPDSIREFRLAAKERLHDGLCMAGAGRRTAAVYLWGYVAEMTIKAAYFEVMGFMAAQTIAINHLHGAKAYAAGLGIAWKGGNFHSVESWAELLVGVRGLQPGWAYADPTLAGQVLGNARAIACLWTETLRYRKNLAYPFEANRAREAAEWFLSNMHRI
jgi:hypothetical protein